jgi:hypothetical protein
LHVTGYGDDPAYQMSLESGTVSRALEISSLQTCIDFFYEVHHRHKRDLFLFYILETEMNLYSTGIASSPVLVATSTLTWL